MLTAMSWIAAGLAGSLVFVLAGIVAAQSGPGSEAAPTTNVEVRVWQSVSDAGRLYLSARAVGGLWRDLGTVPLDVSGLSASGRYRYGDIPLDVPGAGSDETATVQVRVWQSVNDAGSLYISARWAGGSWRDLGTRALDLDDVSSSGRYRYSDSTLISPTYLPTIMFHGAISERKQDEIREKILDTMAFYLNLYGVAAPDIMFHIGENAAVLRTIIDEEAGEPQNISCGLYFGGGVIFILISCENRAIEHEYFHAIQDHSIAHGDWGPIWLTEGFAEHASRLYRDSIGQERYDDAIAFDLETLGKWGLPSLQSLDDLPVWFDDNWAMATLAVDWLAQQASGDPFAYYRMMSQGISWEQAFQGVFGINVGDMYMEFENFLNEITPEIHHIQGTVVGHDENPIREWLLYVLAFQFDIESDLGRSAIVSDNGTFVLHAPDGNYWLMIEARCRENRIEIGWYSKGIGLISDPPSSLSPIVVDADIDKISIKIPRSLSTFSSHCTIGDYRYLSGVVYHSDGSPFPAIRITALDADRFVRGVSVTDENGTFSLQVPDFSYFLDIRSECGNDDSAFLGVYHPDGGFTPVQIVGEEPRILVDGRDVSGVTIRIPAEYADECQRYR